jgi:hypothetical protein
MSFAQGLVFIKETDLFLNAKPVVQSHQNP